MPAQIHERRGQEMTREEVKSACNSLEQNPNYKFGGNGPTGTQSPSSTPTNANTKPSPFGGKGKNLKA